MFNKFSRNKENKLTINQIIPENLQTEYPFNNYFNRQDLTINNQSKLKANNH